MPTWGEILHTFTENAKAQPMLAGSFLDGMRRSYLNEYSQHTGRRAFLYATCWLQKPNANAHLTAITDEDMQGFMEIMHGVTGNSLDLILHSPGGSPEAAEMIVDYLRSKFDDVRVIVPHMAMSAASMIACSADRIVMGKHSSIGPIDPQMISRNFAAPAGAILDQFDLAKQECADPKGFNAWIPILPAYGPALLKQCKYAQELAEELVSNWLIRYMFKADPDAANKAASIARKLADHEDHKSHGRHLTRTTAREYGLVVDALEDDQRTQDLALSVYHCATLAFTNTSVVKIIENDAGKAFMKNEVQPGLQMMMPFGPMQFGPPHPITPPNQP